LAFRTRVGRAFYEHPTRFQPFSSASAQVLYLPASRDQPFTHLYSRENTEEVHAVLSKMVLLRLLLAPETLSWVVKYYFGTEKERLKDWLFIVKVDYMFLNVCHWLHEFVYWGWGRKQLGEVSNNAVFEQLLDEMFKPDHCMTLSLFCSFVQALSIFFIISIIFFFFSRAKFSRRECSLYKTCGSKTVLFCARFATPAILFNSGRCSSLLSRRTFL
jgi:hypothetical protein